jgi:hypothetical protein
LFPHRCPSREIRWVKPTYIAIHTVLSNPVYAGAYAYGKSRCERYVDETGRVRKRMRLLPQDQWAVLIPNHKGVGGGQIHTAQRGQVATNTGKPTRRKQLWLRLGRAARYRRMAFGTASNWPRIRDFQTGAD